MNNNVLNLNETTSLMAENAYAFAKFELTERDFRDESVTGFFGRNDDQLSDNGAGKSTVAKLLYYARYGKDLNGKTLDKITRRGAEGHCVQETFKKNGRTYKIKRFRNWTPDPTSILHDPKEQFHKTGKNTGVYFYIDGVLWTDDDNSDVQAQIESVLGMSSDLFLASVLLKQDGGSPFLNADQDKRQKLITEIQNLQPFNVGEEKIKKIATAHNKQIASLKAHIEVQTKMILQKEKEVPVLQEKSKAFELSREAKLAEHRRELKPLLEKHKVESTKDLKLVDVLPLKSEVERLESEKRKLSEVLEASRTSELLSAIRNDKQTCELEQRTVLHSIDSTKALILTLEKQGISTEALEHQMAAVQKQIDEISDAQELVAFEEKEKQAHSISGVLGGHKKTLELYRQKLEELTHSLSCPTCKRAWEGEALNAKVSEIEEYKKLIATEESAMATEMSLMTDLQEKISSHKRWLKKQSLQTDIRSLHGKIEETQKRKASHESEQLRLPVLMKNLEDLRERFSQLSLSEKSELERIDSTLGEIKGKLLDFETSLSVARQKISDADRLNAELNSHATYVKALKDQIESLKSLGMALKEQPNAFDEAIKLAEKDLKDLKSELALAEENLKVAEEDQMYIDFWREGMSEAGIKSFCADDFLIDLNEHANRYLAPLYEDALRIEFQSQSVSKKGVINNEITPKYFLAGEETDLGEISGGEQGRVELAVNLAIADVAEMRSGVKSSFRFLDEPFAGICSSGQLKCLAVLKQIAQEKNTKFFLVSHDPALQNMIRHKIVIRKKHKVAEIIMNNIDSLQGSGNPHQELKQWILFSENDDVWQVVEGVSLGQGSVVGTYPSLEQAKLENPGAILAENLEYRRAL